MIISGKYDWKIMIIIKDLEIIQNSVLNNPEGVDMALNKMN